MKKIREIIKPSQNVVTNSFFGIPEYLDTRQAGQRQMYLVRGLEGGRQI